MLSMGLMEVQLSVFVSDAQATRHERHVKVRACAADCGPSRGCRSSLLMYSNSTLTGSGPLGSFASAGAACERSISRSAKPDRAKVGEA